MNKQIRHFRLPYRQNTIESRLGNSLHKCFLSLGFKNCPHCSVEWLHDKKDWPRRSR